MTTKTRKPRSPARKARAAFSRDDLARICTMPEREFASAFGMQTVMVDQAAPDNFYHFRDNGSRVLAVAHLDTVAPAGQRAAHFVGSEAGPVVFSRALDDRLGAYIILDLLPALGITCDWLLTTGEETGQSTAAFFEPPKDYDWIIQFDRGGTDVVMYQYDDEDTRQAVKEAGARVGEGIFSDICYLEHLEVKGFNWGTGYRDYHSIRSHAFLNDTFAMVGRFLRFHELNAGITMPHDAAVWPAPAEAGQCEVCMSRGTVDPVTLICGECRYCQDCNSHIDECSCYTPDGASEAAVVHAAEAITGSYAANGERPAGQDWDAEQAAFAQRVTSIEEAVDAGLVAQFRAAGGREEESA